MNNKIIIINGPNLNLLGEREQSQYGSITFDKLKENCQKKSTSIFKSVPFFIHFSLRSSNVTVPYCDCSLSPNRLRLGPLIIIILLFIQLLYTMKKIKKIKIRVNGKKTTIVNNFSLVELIDNLNIPLRKVAIEINREIIDKKRIKKMKLKNNDVVEIVHFIGGG